MPKKIGRHVFSGPIPSLERIPKEPGVFVVQKRIGDYEKLIKTEAGEQLRATVSSYANSQSKTLDDDFFKKQQIYTLPIFSLKAGSAIPDEVVQHYKEQDQEKA